MITLEFHIILLGQVPNTIPICTRINPYYNTISIYRAIGLNAGIVYRVRKGL